METEAIVLDCSDHGEADIIVSLFCRDVGKLTAIAKSAKKSQKRFVNKLEPFSLLNISYSRKSTRTLAFLAEAELLASFISIRRDMELYALASILDEFLLLGISENEADESIFDLTLWALRHLDRREHPKTVLALFLIRYFGYLGYRPDLDCCRGCGTTLTPQRKFTFHPGEGRIICSACRGEAAGRIEVSHGTLKILKAAQDCPLERLQRLKLNGQVLAEALTMLHQYGRRIFQREITSWKTMQHYIGG